MTTESGRGGGDEPVAGPATEPTGDGAPSPAAVLDALRTRLFGGDRPYVAVFVGALGLAVVIVSGPVRTWAEERDLVETRQRELEALLEENASLEDRVADLESPSTIEELAREQQGMFRPGEVPYVIVPPQVDQPQLRPDAVVDESEPPGLLERLRQAIADVFE